MSKVQVMDHPLIQHKINYIRNEEVGSKAFSIKSDGYEEQIPVQRISEH